MVGWDDGRGRVLSLSTDSNPYDLGQSSYAQLLQNAANRVAPATAGVTPAPPPWGTGDIPTVPPVPEPSTLALLLAGGQAARFARWSRGAR